MNRETLDDIVKRGLVAYMAEIETRIGNACQVEGDLSWAAYEITQLENAQKLLQDDKARLEIVDHILEEMKLKETTN